VFIEGYALTILVKKNELKLNQFIDPLFEELLIPKPLRKGTKNIVNVDIFITYPVPSIEFSENIYGLLGDS